MIDCPKAADRGSAITLVCVLKDPRPGNVGLRLPVGPGAGLGGGRAWVSASELVLESASASASASELVLESASVSASASASELAWG